MIHNAHAELYIRPLLILYMHANSKYSVTHYLPFCCWYVMLLATLLLQVTSFPPHSLQIVLGQKQTI